MQLTWQLILGMEKKNPAKKNVRQHIDKDINPSLVCLFISLEKTAVYPG